MQRRALTGNDRVVLIDDWVETVSQFAAVRALVEESGAELLGCAVIVDDRTAEARAGPSTPSCAPKSCAPSARRCGS